MAEESDMPTESSRLLGEGPEIQSSSFAARFQVQTPRYIVFVICLVIFCLSIGGALCVVPMTRLLEDILCRNYYDSPHEQVGGIDERLCKIDAIQSELAYLNGLVSTLEAVIGLIVGLPYGILADRIGRKPVAILAVVGSYLQLMWQLAALWFWQILPVRLILISPAFRVIGGGSTVIVAVVYSIVADVESEATRASAFFLMVFSSLTANFIGPLISSKLMEASSPWTALLIAMIILPVGTSLLVFVPETLPHRKDHTYEETSHEGQAFLTRVKSHLRHLSSRLGESFAMMKIPSVTLILLTYLIQMALFLACNQFFVQYVSKRFEWSLAKAGYLLSMRGIVSIFVLLVALPGLSKILLSPSWPFRCSPPRKDLLLAQCSAVCLTIGSLLLAGPNIAILIIGLIVITLADGLGPLCRSLITTFIDPLHTSRIYTLIGLIEAIGSMFAGPVLAWLFTIGMRLNGLWLGLPYLGLALMAGLCAIALFFVRLNSIVIETAAGEEARDSDASQ